MIVNYASCIINKLEALLTDDARVVIYYRHVFIVQATGVQNSTSFGQKPFCRQTFGRQAQHEKRPGPNVLKLFKSAIYEFSQYARVFVSGKSI
jgi:hypothetical protein